MSVSFCFPLFSSAQEPSGNKKNLPSGQVSYNDELYKIFPIKFEFAKWQG